MSNRVKYGILWVVLAQIAAIIGLLLLPTLAQALPGQYRVRLAQVSLGETLLEIGAVPMPTVLPAPSGAAAQSRVVIPTIAAIAPTATATPAIKEAESRSERFTQMFPFGTFFLLHRIANATSPQASLPAELAVVVSRFVFETTKWVRSYPQYRLGFRH
jgi:hypothetical protein